LLSYFVVFILLALMALFSMEPKLRHYTGLLVALCLVVIAIFSGIRSGDVAADYESYKDIFSQFDGVFDGGFQQVLNDDYFFEPGFAFLIVIIKSFTANFVVFLILISLLTSFLLFFTLKKLTVFPVLAILIFYSYDFFTNYMVAIRFGLASTLGLFVLLQISNKKYTVAFILILISMTLHTAAIVLFLPYFLSFIKLKRSYVLLTLGLALIMGYVEIGGVILNYFMLDWLPRVSSAEVYMNDESYGQSLSFLGMINLKYLILAFLTYIFWNKLSLKFKHFDMLVWFLLSTIILRIGFHELGFIIGRTSALLGIVEIIIVPLLFAIVFKNKLLCFIGVIVYALIHLLFVLFVKNYGAYSSVLVWN